MNRDCPRCDSDSIDFIYSFLDDIEVLENGSLVIYYYCFDCKTEYQIVYRPEEKSITSEES